MPFSCILWHMTERQIIIKQENRRSLMMRVDPAGDVIVLIPKRLRPNSPQVRQFIEQGLNKLKPHLPTETREPLHDAATIRRMVEEWAARMGLNPGRIQLRTMYRKWGSCSTSGNITLNTALYWVPLHLAEYVVVHELAHLRIFNHSPAFWKLVGQYIPDYEARERELDSYRV
ncbi:MAG: hypothetical protein OHK0046_50590 [Anaerolineae bacterium]